MKSYKRDCSLCRLFISVTSQVLDKMYINREREAHTFQLHLFTAQLTTVKNTTGRRQQEKNEETFVDKILFIEKTTFWPCREITVLYSVTSPAYAVK